MEVFEFGPYRLDAAERSLQRSGQPVTLTPKALDVLSVLVRNAGAVVEKDRLLEAVWPNTFVEEGILAVNVATLRKALQDGDGHSYIETVPRRGYRFVAEVRRPETSSRVPRHTPRRVAVLAICAVASALAVVVYWLAPSATPPAQFRLRPFVTEMATETWPAFSPNGGAVAYLRGRPASFELVVRSLDGSAPTVLDQNLRMGRIAWTRDGSRVCYGRDGGFWCVGAVGGPPRLVLRGVTSAQFGPGDVSLLFIQVLQGKPRLMSSAPPGAEPKPVVEVELPGTISELVSPLSPDESRLVAADPSAWDCWIVPFPAGTARRAGFRTRAAAWFPDSRRVLYAESKIEAGGLLTVGGEGSQPGRQILQTPVSIFSASLRPDGAQAIIATGMPDWDIVEFTIDGKLVGKAAASAAQDVAPDWSPAGDGFLYVGNSTGPYAIWKTGAIGVAPVWLANIDRSNYAKPLFSPDAKRIAYGDALGLNVIAAHGGAPAPVVQTRDHVSSLCWSSDGETIYFARRGTIWRVAGQGGVPAPVGKGSFVIDASAGGKWIAYSPTEGRSLYSTSGEVRLMSPDGVADLPLASGIPIAGAFAPGGKRYYTLNPDQRSLSEWVVDTRRWSGRVNLDLPAHDGVFDLAVHPGGERLLLMSGGLRLDLWLVEGWRP